MTAKSFMVDRRQEKLPGDLYRKSIKPTQNQFVMFGMFFSHQHHLMYASNSVYLVYKMLCTLYTKCTQ